MIPLLNCKEVYSWKFPAGPTPPPYHIFASLPSVKSLIFLRHPKNQGFPLVPRYHSGGSIHPSPTAIATAAARFGTLKFAKVCCKGIPLAALLYYVLNRMG